MTGINFSVLELLIISLNNTDVLIIPKIFQNKKNRYSRFFDLSKYLIQSPSVYEPWVVYQRIKITERFYFLPHFSQTTNRGEATKIEEYVPTPMPIVNAKTKALIDSPP